MSSIVCLSTLSNEYILDAHVFPCVAPLGLSLVVGCEYLLPDLLFLLLWVGTYRCCITLQMQREHWMEAVCPNILVLPLISIILATLLLNSKPGTDLYIKAPNCLWHGCDILFCDREHHLNVLETNTLWRCICFTHGFSSGLWSFFVFKLNTLCTGFLRSQGSQSCCLRTEI